MQTKQDLAQALPWGLGEAAIQVGIVALQIALLVIWVDLTRKGLYFIFGVEEQ
ncbi:MAG TPA: hypothetical protein VHD31_01450 [Candidatus Paceibacterota bacterium]|nr:hypothetical protein [Candidatus Paceibacterota bacterium]